MLATNNHLQDCSESKTILISYLYTLKLDCFARAAEKEIDNITLDRYISYAERAALKKRRFDLLVGMQHFGLIR